MEQSLRNGIVAIGKRLYAKNMVAANDGNISVRCGDGLFLATPTGVSKGDLTQESLLLVDADGKVVKGEGRATSELRLHLAAYAARKDINAVVHAHPPAATAYSICGGDFTSVTMAEMVLVVGKVGVSPYATPTTEEVPVSVAPYLSDCDAILLQNHGAMAMGKHLWEAYYRMESLEHYCKTNIYVHMLGGGRCLSGQEVDALQNIRAGAALRK